MAAILDLCKFDPLILKSQLGNTPDLDSALTIQ